MPSVGKTTVWTARRFRLPHYNKNSLASELKAWVKKRDGRIRIEHAFLLPLQGSTQKTSIEMGKPGWVPLGLVTTSSGESAYTLQLIYEPPVLYIYKSRDNLPDLFDDVMEALLVPYIRQNGGKPIDDQEYLVDRSLLNWTERILQEGVHGVFKKLVQRGHVLDAPPGTSLGAGHADPSENQPETNRPVGSPSAATAESPRAGLPIQIFISYRRRDSADVTGRIYDRLVDRFGPDRVFKDVDSIPMGADFRKLLDQMVARCNAFLAVIGPEWSDTHRPDGERRLDDERDFVRIEIESALARKIPVIPLLVRGAEVPSEDQLPPSIRELIFRNGMPIRPDPDFHRDMDRLITSLEEQFQGSR